MKGETSISRRSHWKTITLLLWVKNTCFFNQHACIFNKKLIFLLNFREWNGFLSELLARGKYIFVFMSDCSNPFYEKALTQQSKAWRINCWSIQLTHNRDEEIPYCVKFHFTFGFVIWYCWFFHISISRESGDSSKIHVHFLRACRFSELNSKSTEKARKMNFDSDKLIFYHFSMS